MSSISFKYWDDCVNTQDMEAMWRAPKVCAEWLDAGETKGRKVHLSLDPDGHAYLTQTEMKVVADIIIHRHFDSQIHPDMVCVIAELESNRQPLANRYNKKTKVTTVGLMQISPETAEWLARDSGYESYRLGENANILCHPFVNVYYGAAYLKWLSNFEQKAQSEEFVVRAYNGGTNKSARKSKSTLQYWKRYLSVKESISSSFI